MKIFLRVFLAIGCVSAALAQAPIRQGSFELGTFMGASYNVSEGAVMGGANVSYAVTKIFLPYVEYSYFPSIERTASTTAANTGNAFTTNYSSHASDFHVGVHVRFQIRESRFAPYGVFGIGGLPVSGGVINGITYGTGNGQTGYMGCVPSAPSSCKNLGIAVPGTNSVAVNFGGGVRYYLTPRYGFRVEVKGYKPVSSQQYSGSTILGPVAVTNSFLKAEGGFFIQFK